MPMSACASAGASFKPSPTIATRRPLRCSDLIASTLPSGSTSAMTSSMPTCFAIASAVARRSPLSITTRRPRRRSDDTTAWASGRNVSAIANAAATRPSMAAITTVRPWLVHDAMRVLHDARIDLRFLEERVGADRSHDGRRREPRRHGQRCATKSVTGRLKSGLHVAGGLASECRQSPSPVDAPTVASTAAIILEHGISVVARRRAAKSTTCGVPCVSVPVLSKTTVSTSASRSSGSPPLISTPAAAPRPLATITAVGTASPIAHGQAMISTATAAVSADGRRWLGGHDHPCRERGDRDRHHRWHEHRRDAVGQPLNRRLRSLRFLHQRDDARQHARRRRCWWPRCPARPTC